MAASQGSRPRPASATNHWRRRGAVLAALLCMAARPATAQELEKIRQAAGIESASLGAAAPAQLLTGLRLTGERYAEGPGLGKTETIGEASLLKGLAAEEAYAYPRVPTYLKKTKRKQARASTRIEY